MSQEPATVHPINSGATAAQQQPTEIKTDKPERTRVKPHFTLPTDRIVPEKQLTLLRAYDAASDHGKKAVKINDVADASKISGTTISLANGFFLEIGLIQKSDAGFVPSEEVSAFAMAHQWGPETAAHKLAPVIRRSWFAERVMPTILVDRARENELIDSLLLAAGVGQDFRPRARILLDWLVLAGIAERDGEFLRRGPIATAGAPAAPTAVSQQERLPIAPELRDASPQRDGQVRSSVNSAFTQMTGGSVQFNISVKVDMTEFANWPPDLVTAFFGGIAQVLSAKAAVEKAASKDE
jgi:hypothetical protein